MTRRNDAHLALYLKYRSHTLDEVVGQAHITGLLSQALKKGRLAHAYLFTGPRGVGKTSVARILAHEITGLEYNPEAFYPDIVEIDAASNRRIDDIRELRDKAQIAPTAASYKVYIIDEVHMLTGESFNALLKTLEEPPAHVVFILATTDAHKLPSTVTSRTQRYSFRAITVSDAVAHLQGIANKEKIKVSGEALQLIAEHGDGSFRDSISLLDQLASLVDDKQSIDREIVESVLGLAEATQINDILNLYLEANDSAIIQALSQLLDSGIQPGVIAAQLIQQALQRVAEKPTLAEAIDKLIAVQSSPRPDARLLIALISAQAPVKPKVVLASTAASPGLTVLAEQASQKKPVDKPVNQSPTTSRLNEPDATIVAIKSSTRTVTATPTEQPIAATIPAGSVSDQDFAWASLVAEAKQNSLAFGSILAKCEAVLTDGKLVVYTGTALWKSKLDTTKYRSLLQTYLAGAGFSNLEIETIPERLPIRNTTASAVSAIMGGGVEVSLEGTL